METAPLASVVAASYPASGADRERLGKEAEDALDGLFGSRYHSRSRFEKRVAFMDPGKNVPFAGLVHHESPSSGVYGGMSLCWFPVPQDDEAAPSSLLTFVCGTRGLSPDEQILGRPGHARHLRALRRYLAAQGIEAWVKHDPANLAEPIPRVVQDSLGARYDSILKKYGNFIYACAEVPRSPDAAQRLVTAFLDFYARERGWHVLKAAQSEFDKLLVSLRSHLFPRVDREDVVSLLRQRRFVVLQGPPGTGKTRLAGEVLHNDFDGEGTIVQFHPAVTYESFVAGIAPEVEAAGLRFVVKSGWLVDAFRQAQEREYLLVVDEINRADLGRVLGEAIYLFEPREIGGGEHRAVRLPQSLPDGSRELVIPPGFFLLGTMNTADRSIAILDLAVRRRFAFVDMWPDLGVIAQTGSSLAIEASGRLQEIFAQYAPDDALVLLPGHAYFLADSEGELRNRLKYELIPLLEEYLQEGRLGPCESELRAYLEWLDGEIENPHDSR